MRTLFALQPLFAFRNGCGYAATVTDTSESVPTRRTANRTATLTAIKAAALQQVAEQGAPALSIRGVARAVGLSPAGMYRYYEGRDALLTDLLVDAYSDLADTVATAAGLPGPGPEHPDVARDVAASPPSVRDPVAALLRAIEAYRGWAVANPARFLLIFGTPVPGYEAPPDGPTVAANRRMGQVFFTLAALAWREGRITAPAEPTSGPATACRTAPQGSPDALGSPDAESGLLTQLQALAPGFPRALIPRMLAGWALWHGLITLEITGQLHWIYPDTGTYYSGRMAEWVSSFTSGR
jgi:AcrR family transcriptional regulator